ncbi:hypothetical protein WICPIJ_003308 [Wickerhamomyces pijperi]|uniref:Topoisomerase 1-associated factor 1 n=1 Tax=Wickerhamomyces pijperi TaxID=599730 RepID=A0A9P8Q7V7_WICPI|nr:hypothetical protein WICPIJ_003308 [Wickerhamomyces pijperi]
MTELEEQTAINLSDEDDDFGFIANHNRQLIETDDEDDQHQQKQQSNEDQATYELNGKTLTSEQILNEQIKSQIVQQALALLSKDPTTGKFKLQPETYVLLTEIRVNLYTDNKYSWVVSVACGESSLMDCVIEILRLWANSLEDNENNSGFTDNFEDGFAIVAECVEILSFLTKWFELPANNDEDGTEPSELLISNYFAIKKHQLIYKKKLLSRYKGSTLSNLVKVCSFIVTKPKTQRTQSDWNTLQFCLEVLAHIPAIEPAAAISSSRSKNGSRTREMPSVLPLNLTLSEIDSNVCIAVYQENKVLGFVVTLCSVLKDLNKSFVTECIHDVLYHLTKKVDPADVYMSKQTTSITNPNATNSPINHYETQPSTAKNSLKSLITEETRRQAQSHKATRSSRHGRFGTLLQIKATTDTSLTLAGPANLSSRKNVNVLAEFEKHKKWKRPVILTYGADEDITYSFETLSRGSRDVLFGFIQDFIKSGANILMYESTKDLATNLEDEDLKNLANGVNTKPLAIRRRRYFILIAWVLRFFQASNEGKFQKAKFQYILGALTDSSFALVHQALNIGFTRKDWALSHSALICVMEMVRVSRRFGESSDMAMKVFGDSLKERLFHNKHNVQGLIKYTREASKRSPRFISTCVELLDLLVSTLEDISKENMTEFVKRKKTLKSKRINSYEYQAIENIDISDREQFKSLVQDLASQRKKAFQDFQGTLVNSGTVSMYIKYLQRFQDLSEVEIKRAIKFLHRLFFQMKKYPTLYRVDFLILLNNMVSFDGLPEASSSRKHVEQFLDHFIVKFQKSLVNSSSTLVEMFFPDFRDKDINYFLETGSIRGKDPEKILRASKVATIKGEKEMELERKCAIMVASLVDDDKLNLVKWTSKEMEKVYVVRSQQLQLDDPIEGQAADDPEFNPNLKDIKVESDDPAYKKTLIVEPKVRYLFQLAGFQLPVTIEDPCFFSKTKPLPQLTEVMGYINKYAETTVDFENGKVASDFVLIRTLQKYYNDLNKEDELDDQFGGSYSDREDDDEAIAFEITGERRREVGYLDDELDQLEDVIDRAEGGSGQRGVARSKNRDKEGAHLGKRAGSKKSRSKNKDRTKRSASTRDGSKEKETEKEHEKSSRYVEDSDSDNDNDDIFFLREKMLHNFFIENNGAPSKEAVTEFLKELDAQFSSSKTARVRNQKPREGLFVEDDEASDEESDVVDDSDDMGVLADDYDGPIGTTTSTVADENDNAEEVESGTTKSRARTFSQSEDEDSEHEIIANKRQRRVLDSEDEDGDDGSEEELVVTGQVNEAESETRTPPASFSADSTKPTTSIFSDDEQNDFEDKANTSGISTSRKPKIFSDDEEDEELENNNVVVTEVPKPARTRAIIEDDEYDE